MNNPNHLYPLPRAADAAAVTAFVLKNWIARDVLTFAGDEPRAGHARMVPLIGIYEAAWIGALANGSVSPKTAAQAFNRTVGLWTAAETMGASAAGRARAAELRARTPKHRAIMPSQMPDWLAWRDAAMPCYGVLVIGIGGVPGIELAKGLDDVPAIVRRAMDEGVSPERPFTAVNVTALLTAVDARLKASE